MVLEKHILLASIRDYQLEIQNTRQFMMRATDNERRQCAKDIRTWHKQITKLNKKLMNVDKKGFFVRVRESIKSATFSEPPKLHEKDQHRVPNTD